MIKTVNIKKYSLIMCTYLICFVLYDITYNSMFQLAICVFNVLFLLLFGKNVIEIIVMSSFFMGAELYIFLNVIISIVYIIFKFGKGKKIKVKKIPLMFAFVLIVSTMCNVLFGGNIWNAIFGISYYFVLVLLYISLGKNLREDRVLQAVKGFVVIEGILFIQDCIRVGFVPGDTFKGSFSDAHILGFAMCACFVYIFLDCISEYNNIGGGIKKNIIYFAMLIVMIYLSDAKNVIVGFLVGFLVYCATRLNRNKSQRVFLSIIILYCSLYVGTIILGHDNVKSFIYEKAPNISIYIYDANYNYKVAYFTGTIKEELDGPRIIFGYGLGHYGSRIANLFGYESMYREDSAINNLVANNFKPFIRPEYEKYASTYSTKLRQEIQWRSAVLSYPFSSFVSFLAENGIVGMVLLVYILSSISKNNKYGVLIVFLIACSIFDLYFDKIVCTGLVLTLLQSYGASRSTEINSEINRQQMN